MKSTKQRETEFREALSEAKTPREIREAVMLLPDYKVSTSETMLECFSSDIKSNKDGK